MPSKATKSRKPVKGKTTTRPRQSAPAAPTRRASSDDGAAVPAAEAQVAYAALVDRFAGRPGVTLPAEKRGKFGSNGLKVGGKIFAMLIQRGLAVKLSSEDVEAATKAGRGEPLSMGRRVMKEWLLVNEPPRKWYAIAEQARAFVAGAR